MDLTLNSSPTLRLLQHQLSDGNNNTLGFQKIQNAPTRSYVGDCATKAMMDATPPPADVKEYPNSYVYVIDMPGLKSGDIKVQVEDDKVLVISWERKREEENELGAKYLTKERRVGKLMRKFVLSENADSDAVSAVCQDGLLTITVNKLPPPQPKKPRLIEVKVA